MGNGGATLVAIRESATLLLVETAVPDVVTGEWSGLVPSGTYDITYYEEHCQPVCHGPYTVS